SLMAIGAVRALPRLIRSDYWHYFAPAKGKRCLIVGADYPGEALLRSTRTNPNLDCCVVGFIDDRAELQNSRIGGVAVLGTTRNLPRLVKRHAVEEVLIISGSLSGRQMRELVDS